MLEEFSGNVAMLTGVGILVVVLVVALLVFGIYARTRYKTVPSNRALIITGPNLGDPKNDNRIFNDKNGRSMKVIRGGGAWMKMFQTSTPVPLNSFQIQLTTPRVYTLEGVPIIADAIASVKVADDLQGIANYAEQFLGKDSQVREDEVSKVLGTNLRAILSKMSVEGINNDRESFNNQVQEIAQKELDNMGFKITSFGLDDLRDADPENGYLENLGRPRIAEVRKKAELAESDAEKETRMYKAKNNQEAQDEENKRLTDISESRKVKDLKEAQIKEETERARAKSEQSYQLEKTRLAQEIEREETKRVIIEKQKEVNLEIEEQSRRKAKADANAYDVETQARAEAARMKIQGETEAGIIREKGRAEAEAKELMAKALENYGEAAIMEMMIEMLPKYAREIALPLATIKDVKIIDMGGSGGEGGVNSVTKNVTTTMLGIQDTLKETTGMDLKALMESFVSRGAVNNFNSGDVPSPTIVTETKEETNDEDKPE